MVVGGLAATAHQAIVWRESGYWTEMHLRTLWFALGDAAPDALGWLGIDDIMAWVLNQPLNVVFFVVGGYLTWIGLSNRGPRCT